MRLRRLQLPALAAITALAILAPPRAASAKARFMRLPEVAAASDLVAVITVTRSQKANAKPAGGHWSYQQRNTFRVDTTIRRALDLPAVRGQQTLWAEKTFICARASYRVGRYLVFLQRLPGGGWITLNHQMGAMPVQGAAVPGFAPNYGGRARTLAAIRARIAAVTLSGVGASFRAEVRVAPTWRKAAPHQRVRLTLPWSPQPKNWPAGLRWQVPALVPTSLLPAATAAALRRTPRQMQITGRWKRGTFVVSRMTPAATP